MSILKCHKLNRLYNVPCMLFCAISLTDIPILLVPRSIHDAKGSAALRKCSMLMHVADNLSNLTINKSLLRDSLYRRVLLCHTGSPNWGRRRKNISFSVSQSFLVSGCFPVDHNINSRVVMACLSLVDCLFVTCLVTCWRHVEFILTLYIMMGHSSLQRGNKKARENIDHLNSRRLKLWIIVTALLVKRGKKWSRN